MRHVRGLNMLAYSAPASDGAASTRASECDAHVGGVTIERAAQRPIKRRGGQASDAAIERAARRPSEWRDDQASGAATK